MYKPFKPFARGPTACKCEAVTQLSLSDSILPNPSRTPQLQPESFPALGSLLGWEAAP